MGSVLVCMTVCCPDEVNCRECTFSASQKIGRCQNCEYSIYNKASNQCASIDVDNCLRYTETPTTRCVECELGYTIASGTNLCQKCQVENCAYCLQGVQYCNGCLNKMTPDISLTTCSSAKSCAMPNCQICITYLKRDFCKVCDPGFSFKDGNSFDCVPGLPNCAYFLSHALDKCASCNSGFFITSNGTCKSSTKYHTALWLTKSLIVVFTLAFAVLSVFIYNLMKNRSDQVTSYIFG
jgi:hypothetical protein